jgi:hypothetical protein
VMKGVKHLLYHVRIEDEHGVCLKAKEVCTKPNPYNVLGDNTFASNDVLRHENLGPLSVSSSCVNEARALDPRSIEDSGLGDGIKDSILDGIS